MARPCSAENLFLMLTNEDCAASGVVCEDTCTTHSLLATAAVFVAGAGAGLGLATGFGFGLGNGLAVGIPVSPVDTAPSIAANCVGVSDAVLSAG